MKLKMTVRGLSALDNNMRTRANASKKKDEGQVIVGYTMNYALHVHERTDIPHANGKQAKYLETAYRETYPLIKKIAKKAYKQSGSLMKGLFVAGLMVQRRSQQIVPIDTGALRASAYTAKRVRSNRG